MQKVSLVIRFLLILSISLASQANLQVEFNRADAFLKQYPSGLSADELLTLEYTPSKNENSNAKQQTLDNNNNANTDNNNADDTETDTTANNSNSIGENTENI